MAAFATGGRGQFPACSRSLMAQPLFTTLPECCYQHGSPLHQNAAVSINHCFIRTLLSSSVKSLFTVLSECCCQHLFSCGSPLYQNVVSMVHRFIRTLLSASAQPWFTTSSERYCQHESPLHQNAAVSINHCFIRTLLSASAPVALVVFRVGAAPEL